MIVLDAIGPEGHSASVRGTGRSGSVDADELSRIRTTLEDIGFPNVHLDDGATDSEDTLFQHRWEKTSQGVLYRSSFPHAESSSALIDCYVALVLAVSGCGERRQLMELRLALYELCRNVLDHGRPMVEDPRVELGLQVTQEMVSGWIQDQCERFDEENQKRRNAQDLAKAKASRGYGMTLIRRVLPDCTRDFNERGNRISFNKRMNP